MTPIQSSETEDCAATRCGKHHFGIINSITATFTIKGTDKPLTLE